MDHFEHSDAAPRPGTIVPALGVYALVIVIAIIAGGVLDRFGPKAAFAFVFALPLVLLGIRDFRTVCSAAVFVLPFVPTVLLSRQVTGLSGIDTMLGLLAFAAGATFLYCALRPGQITMPRFPALLLVYLMVLILGAANGARHAGETPDYLVALGLADSTTPGSYLKATLIAPILVLGAALVAGVLAANTSNPRWLLVPVLCSAPIVAAITYVFALKGGASLGEMAGQDARQLLSATGQHANEISLTLNMALAVTLGAFSAAPSRGSRLVLGCCALLLLGGVYLTFSRGGYIGSVVVILYFVLTYRGKHRLKLPLLLLLAGIVLAAPEAMVERTTQTGSGGLGNVSSGRVDAIWRPLVPSVLENPLVGKGHGAILWSDAAKARAILPVGHPHNAYLAALLDVGLIGTLAVLAFLAHVWRTLWRLGAAPASGALSAFYYGASACIPLLLVQGMTDDSFMPRYTHAYLWIAYGAAIGTLSRRIPVQRAAARPASLQTNHQGGT